MNKNEIINIITTVQTEAEKSLAAIFTAYLKRHYANKCETFNRDWVEEELYQNAHDWGFEEHFIEAHNNYLMNLGVRITDIDKVVTLIDYDRILGYIESVWNVIPFPKVGESLKCPDSYNKAIWNDMDF